MTFRQSAQRRSAWKSSALPEQDFDRLAWCRQAAAWRSDLFLAVGRQINRCTIDRKLVRRFL